MCSVYMYLYECMCMRARTHVWKPEEGVGSLRVRVKGVCRMHSWCWMVSLIILWYLLSFWVNIVFHVRTNLEFKRNDGGRREREKEKDKQDSGGKVGQCGCFYPCQVCDLLETHCFRFPCKLPGWFLEDLPLFISLSLPI